MTLQVIEVLPFSHVYCYSSKGVKNVLVAASQTGEMSGFLCIISLNIEHNVYGPLIRQNKTFKCFFF